MMLGELTTFNLYPAFLPVVWVVGELHGARQCQRQSNSTRNQKKKTDNQQDIRRRTLLAHTTLTTY